MSRYAVIGWGSLIWDLEVLAPHVDGGWRMRKGPRLPLEFSRISPKRRMGLAVCLDPDAGAPCPTHWIRSTRARAARAALDLARRERAVPWRIGHVCLLSGSRHGRLPPVVDAVSAWCRCRGLAGAVWTDLETNFAERRGQPFSVEAGMAYLRTLEGESLDEAVRYIRNAPAATDTPLRRRLAADPWWHAQLRRLDRAG